MRMARKKTPTTTSTIPRARLEPDRLGADVASGWMPEGGCVGRGTQGDVAGSATATAAAARSAGYVAGPAKLNRRSAERVALARAGPEHRVDRAVAMPQLEGELDRVGDELLGVAHGVDRGASRGQPGGDRGREGAAAPMRVGRID